MITLNYFINQAEITELFCINKAQPQLQCNGKCHLIKELVKADTQNEEMPFSQNANEYHLELTFILDKKADNPCFHLSEKNTEWLAFSEEFTNRTIDILTPPPKV